MELIGYIICFLAGAGVCLCGIFAGRGGAAGARCDTEDGKPIGSGESEDAKIIKDWENLLRYDGGVQEEGDDDR